MKIRLFKQEDSPQIAQLFHDTVRNINIQDYSLEQVKAWAPEDINFRNWSDITFQKIIYVAEKNQRILGFGELETNGHIDCFYVHHQYLRRGFGSEIYQAIELKARTLNLNRLFTEASISAQPFFIKQGFSTISKNLVHCRGQRLTNFSMEKSLID